MDTIDFENQQKNAVSKLIKRIRYENHWTQKEFGEILGVSDQAIRAYETKKRLPKTELLRKLGSYTNIEVGDPDFYINYGPHLSVSLLPIQLTTLGDYIREIRKVREMTQEGLGKKIGVTKAMISAYETGKRTPKNATLSKIAEALQVPLENLITGDVGKILIPEESSSKIKGLEVHGNAYISAETSGEKVDYDKEAGISSVSAPIMPTIKCSKESESPITKQFELLNSTGQKKVFEYIKDLLSIPAYQRRETICQEQQKTQVPSESEQTEPGKQE